MTKLVICGQAPSRVGDGRAFSGPSGKRLAQMLHLEDYEALAKAVTLTNIFDQPAVKRSDRGDTFDSLKGRHRGVEMMKEWARDPELVVVLACGRLVARCLTGMPPVMYGGKAIRLGPAQGVDVWHFPHPSGASSYWNKLQNRRVAIDFLDRLLKRYQIDLTQ